MTKFKTQPSCFCYPHSSDKLSACFQISGRLRTELYAFSLMYGQFDLAIEVTTMEQMLHNNPKNWLSHVEHNMEFVNQFHLQLRYEGHESDKVENLVQLILQTNKVVVQASHQELSDRTAYANTMPFSENVLETKDGKIIDPCTNAPLLTATATCSLGLPSSSILKCDDVAITRVALWIQQMLQLEGDDRFSTVQYAEYLSARTRAFSCCSANARIIFNGDITDRPYHADVHCPRYITETPLIFFRTPAGYKSISGSSMLLMGSTAASSLIRAYDHI